MTELGRDGGDVGGADVVLLAVPAQAVPDGLSTVTGLRGKIVIDATNRFGGASTVEGTPRSPSTSKADGRAGPSVKAFNLNFGSLSNGPPPPRRGRRTSGSATKRPGRRSSNSPATWAWSP